MRENELTGDGRRSDCAVSTCKQPKEQSMIDPCDLSMEDKANKDNIMRKI